ncbi:filamentous hemagglutinin N-terminal domain-containing protein, partial [Catenovulum agarivorans]|uniref:filamentous hemagglutinin N-terminal domain-containing protein n=1 Tax=Catenovulum agarivorans TaxID=1172192 RepID=UPI000364D698
MKNTNNRTQVKNTLAQPLAKSSIAIAVSTALWASQAVAATTSSLNDSAVNSDGGATITGVGDGSTTANITANTQNTIIDWETLGLASDETLNFTGTADSVFLNRVTGNDASLMDGSVNTSNVETLIFVNPNGVTVGSNFNNTGALNSNLMISTKDVSSLSGYSEGAADFGLTLTDSGNNADITINSIRATVNDDKKLNIVSENDVIISNSGTGTDTLGANYLTITADGNVDGSAGAIAADGEISISAGGNVDIESVKAGVIYIDATGTVNVNQSAGTLEIGQVEGSSISLTSLQSLSGGLVKINNPITATTGSQTGQNTSFSDDANLITDGTITITADDTASNNLEIGTSGNAIEINSSGGTLTTSGTKVGNLYFTVDGDLNLGDVTSSGDIQISEASGATSTLTQTGTVTLNKAAGQEISLDFTGVDVDDLDPSVANAANLTIKANDLTIADTIDVSGQTLTINATGTITGEGTLASDFTADTLVITGTTNSGSFDTDVNNLNMTQAGSLTISNEGDLVVGVSNINGTTAISTKNAGDDITLGNAVAVASSASLSLTTADTTGVVTVNGAVSGASGTLNITADNVDLNAAVSTGTVTLDTVTDNAAIDLGTAVGTLNLDATSVTNLTAGTASQTVKIGDDSNTGAVTINSAISNSNVNLDINSGNLTIGSAVTANSIDADAAGTADVNAAVVTTGDTNINATGNFAVSALGSITSSSGDIIVNSDGTVTTDGALSAGNDLTITADGAVDTNQTITAGNDTSISTTTGAVTIDAALTSTGDVSISTSDNSVTTTAKVSGADLTVTSSTGATLITAVDSAAINAGSGDISVTEDDAIALNNIVTTSANTTAVAITSTAGGISSNDSTSIQASSGEIALTAAADIDVNTSGGATFNSLSDGVAITIDANTNTISFTNAVGGGDDVLTVTGLDVQNATDLNTGADAITVTSGDLTLSASGSLTVAGALTATDHVTLQGDTVSLAAVTSDSNTDSTGDILIEAGTGGLALNANVTSNNNDMDIRGLSDSHTIGLGNGAGDVSISQGELDLLQAGTGVITFGKSSGGAVTIDGADLATTTTHQGVDILSAGAVSIANALNVGTVSGDDLDIDAASISNAGSAVVTAVALDVTTTGNADLSGNNLISGTVTSDVSGNLTLTNTTNTTLGTTSAANLTLSANGTVTDAGVITVTGTTDIDSSAANGNVDLSNNTQSLNVFTVAAGTGTVMVDETDALDLGNITASALTVTAGGAVSDSGTLTVSGTTDIDTSAGNADITLNTNTHSLATLIVDAGTGAVDIDETDALTLQVDGAGDVTVDSVGALTLNAGSMANLTVTDATSITDAGALTVTGTTDLDTSTANGAIVLDTFTHNLNTFTADAGTGAIDIDETGALDLGDTTTSALTITAGGAVSDSGTLTVSGTTDIDTSAGNGAITLNTNTHSLNTLVVDSGTGNVDIDETDALTLQVDGAGDVTVDSVGDLTLNAGSMSNLTITDADSVTDAGVLSITSTADIDTSLANGNVDLNNNTHSIGTLMVDAGTGTLDVAETDALTLQVDNAGDVTVDTVGALTLNAGSMSSLTVSAASSITDAGALTVTGATDLDTSVANGNIDLDNATHSLNSLAVNAGTGSVDVDETDAIALGNITAANFTVSAGGAVSDTGTLTVSGTTDIDTASNNSAITLNTNTHSLNTLIVESGTGAVDIDETDALTLQVDSAGDVTIDSVGALTLNTGSMSNLTVSAAASVTDAGALTVTGTTDIDTSTANGNVDLSNNTQSLNVFTVAAGTGTVMVDETDALDLGNITASALTVTAGGAVSDSGTLTVSGTTDIDTSAGNADITLNTNTHSLATLVVDAGTGAVDIDEADALTLQVDGAGDVTVDSVGALTLNAGSMANLTVADATSITDAGALTVTGTTDLDTSTANGAIVLDTFTHNLNTFTADAGTGAIDIDETDALDLGDTTTSALTITAGGEVSDSGTLTVSGTTDIDTSAGNGAITLNTNTHSLNTLVVDSGTGNVDIDETDALTLQVDGAGDVTVDSVGALTLNAGSMANLTVTDADSVTDAGVLSITSTADIDTSANNGNVDLNNNTHSIGTLMVDAGTGTLDVAETDALTLQVDNAGAVTVDTVGALTLNAGSMSSLTVSAASSITDAGALTVTGATDLDTSVANGNIDLDNATHSLNSLAVNAGTGSVDVDETDAIALGNITAANFTVS